MIAKKSLLNSLREAFTILEMIAVMIIVSLLVAIGIPEFQKTIYKSRLVEVCTAVNSIVKGFDAYEMRWSTRVLGENIYAGYGYAAGTDSYERLTDVKLSQEHFAYAIRPNITYPAVNLIYVWPRPECSTWSWTYDHVSKTWANYGNGLGCPYRDNFSVPPFECRP